MNETALRALLIKDEPGPATLSQCDMKRVLDELRESQRRLQRQQKLLRRKNQKLRELRETSQRFIDDVSHDLRTPMTVIKDYVSLVREELAGPVNDEQRRMLDIAAVRVDDLNTMVDDLLASSRLSVGTLEAWRTTARPEELAQLVVPRMQKRAEVKRLKFLVDVPSDLPDVYCDREIAGRVIVNLTVNAMTLCGDAGEVRLSAEFDEPRREVVFHVRDIGPGLAPHELATISRRFKRSTRGRGALAKGLGRGLSIARELVDLNFGRLWVESKPGRGSQFNFSISIADPEEILARYLDQARARECEATVSLVAVELDVATTPRAAEPMDAFFNSLLRRQELALRLDATHWLLVLAARGEQLPRFPDRAGRKWRRINRHRSAGALPEFMLETLGSWPPATERGAILDAARSVLRGSIVPA
jgi:signal transduction histidine kinase